MRRSLKNRTDRHSTKYGGRRMISAGRRTRDADSSGAVRPGTADPGTRGDRRLCRTLAPAHGCQTAPFIPSRNGREREGIQRIPQCFFVRAAAAHGRKMRHPGCAGAAAAAKEHTVVEDDRFTGLPAKRKTGKTCRLRLLEKGRERRVARGIRSTFDAHHHGGREHRGGEAFQPADQRRFHAAVLSVSTICRRAFGSARRHAAVCDQFMVRYCVLHQPYWSS